MDSPPLVTERLRAIVRAVRLAPPSLVLLQTESLTGTIKTQ